MASELFKIDARELIQLRRWYKKQPRKFRIATGMMLNEFAYGTRDSILWIIGRRYIIRNERFVRSHVRVTNARFADPINTQRSMAGTTTGARFTGWAEQEFGTRALNERTATIAGRGGTRKGKLKPSFRLKPSRDVVEMEDYGPVRSLGQFVAMIHERKEKRLIKIKTSLYKRRGRRKLIKVQNLKNRNKQPKRRPFMQTSRKHYFTQTNISALWAKTIKKVMKPPKYSR